MFEIKNFGKAEDVLREHNLLADRARQLLQRNLVPTEDGWGGWLGRYQSGLRKSALELVRQAERLEQTKVQRRQKDRNQSRGR